MSRVARGKKTFVVLIVTLAVIIALFAFCAIYISDYYRADDASIDAFMPNVTTEVCKNDYIAVGNPESEIGFIFYPGGKVEYTSYLPLMRALAARGIFCVLYDMPFNLAVFGINSADGIGEEYPSVKEWYIGGHSLGGSMAASYLSKNPEDFSGIVLLGSYSTADLSSLEIKALSIYGSEDGVMNREKYAKNTKNLPENFTEIIIEGGAHAYFGMYGEQDGDGAASISAENQISMTALYISDFMVS